jgi:ESCRT-I complex subunit VPS28
MDLPAALHRLKVGVPATVEHSSEAGPETGKWVAETTQVRLLPCISFLIRLPRLTFFQNFITFMDALKLRMRAKDQLHPILQELVTGYARFKGSKDWEGRSKMVGWYVTPCDSSIPISHVLYHSLKVDHAQRDESIGGDHR